MQKTCPMKIKTFLFCVIAILLPYLTEAEVRYPTLKETIAMIHDMFDVSFVYDSSLDLDAEYKGTAPDPEISLEKNLDNIFKDTDIRWKIRKRYVILTDNKGSQSYRLLNNAQRDTLEEARITALRNSSDRQSSTGLCRIDNTDMTRGYAFLSSPDAIRCIQNLPGVSMGTEILSGLHVHGGDGSDNLFLLDGVPLYQTGHMGGLYSFFNSDIVDEVNFYKSGFPAQYGGRMSSVIDARTKAGNMYDYHGSMSIGLLDGRLQFEGPINPGKTSLNIAVRRSTAELLLVPYYVVKEFINTSDLQYRFLDFNAGITHRVSSDETLEFKAYFGKDHLAIGLTHIEGHYSYFNLNTDWGNALASLIWKKKLEDRVGMTASISHTMGFSNLKRDEGRQNDFGNVEHEDETSNGEFVLAQLQDNYYAKAHTTTAKADFTLDCPSDDFIGFGIALNLHGYSPERNYTNKTWTEKRGPLSSELKQKINAIGTELAAYGDLSHKFNERCTVNAGLRYVAFGAENKIWHRLEPRMALKYRLGRTLAFSASYTEMNQFAHRLTTSYLDLPTALWMPSTENLPPSLARQISAEVSWNSDYGLNIRGGIWFKTMNNLTENYSEHSYIPPLANWDWTITTGKGRSYGMETQVEYRIHKLSLNAYYTLSWNERLFEDLWYDWYPDRNDNRHKLTLTADYRPSDKIHLYAGWNFHSGNRITAIGYMIPSANSQIPVGYAYGMPNNCQLPDYHRLDLGMNIIKRTENGKQMILNFSIYNVYCRMNPILITIPEHMTIDNQTTYGIMPVIPSFSYTLIF